jgi:hypothetical protein
MFVGSGQPTGSLARMFEDYFPSAIQTHQIWVKCRT